MAVCRASVLLVLAVAAAAPAAEIDPYLPSDADFVLFIQVRQTLDSPLAKKYFLDPARNAFDSDRFKPRLIFQAMQLDPFKDITSLTLAGSGLPELDKGLLVMRGNFDLKTIATVADTESQRAPNTLKVHKQGTFLIYEFPSPRREGAVPLFLCFLDKQTAILSPSRAAVTDAIAKKTGTQRTSLSKEMEALLAQVNGRQSVWLAALASEPLKKELGNNPATKKLVSSLQSVRGGVTLGDGLNADFLIRLGDVRAAGEVRKFLIGIRSLVELAVLGGEWSRKVDDVLKKAFVIAADKEGVRIEVRASAAEIEKVLQAKPKAGE